MPCHLPKSEVLPKEHALGLQDAEQSRRMHRTKNEELHEYGLDHYFAKDPKVGPARLNSMLVRCISLQSYHT